MSAGRVPPELDSEFVADALAVALDGALADAGRSGWVIGLSGGLDSAVAAALAARACGPAAVDALFLPDRATSEAGAETARAVADHLGISLETVPLDGPLDAALPGEPDRRRRGNFATRLRMAIVYDRAADRDGLVLGTSNKSELALGYTTRWGDMAADLWVLGDLYKTQVRDLARALGLPDAVIRREPSAEFWEGQTDEEELGFSYGAADAILYNYIDERRRADEIVERGFPAATVDAVLSRVRSEAFKRRLPATPKLSYRTVGHDFLHPRVWRDPA